MRTLIRIVIALVVGAVAIAGFAVWTLQMPAPLAMPSQGATLGDVTVINPGHSRLEHQTIVLRDGTIETLQAGAEGGLYAGHFVLPGLADAHVHFPPAAIPGQTELFAFLFLLHGVTSIRDAGDIDGTSTLPARDGIRSGAFPGPRMWACGPFIDGPDPLWSNSIAVRTPDQARAAARQVKEAGFDCVKGYSDLSPEAAVALRESARELGIPLIGHVPQGMTYEEARFDDVQHLIGVHARLPDPTVRYPQIMAAWPLTTDSRLRLVATFSQENGIANTPTLVVNDRRAAAVDYDAARSEADAHLLPRFYRDVIWSPTEGTLRGTDDETNAVISAAKPGQLRAVKALHDAGAPLRTGSDVLNPFVVPGASLHRELKLFVDAGLTPEQALAVSRDTANALAGGRAGWIEAGAPADLVIFREDPTRSLDALETLAAVVADGRLYDRAQLDAQMDAYRDAFSGAAYEALTLPIVRRALAATVE